MRIPEAISLQVVEHDGKKKFLVPEGVGNGGYTKVTTPEGDLYGSLFVGEFGSCVPYSPTSLFVREVETPCVVFRRGEYFDNGVLEYVGGQDSGHHVVGSFGKIKVCGGVTLEALDFEVGDVITFLRMNRNDVKKK